MENFEVNTTPKTIMLLIFKNTELFVWKAVYKPFGFSFIKKTLEKFCLYFHAEKLMFNHLEKVLLCKILLPKLIN